MLATATVPNDSMLWLADIKSLSPNWFAGSLSWLSDSEHDRCIRFFQKSRRRQFLAGRIMVRLALGELLGINPRNVLLLDRIGNAPVLLNSLPKPIGLSISHSGDWVACAVSKVALVGLDIECTDTVRDVVALAEQAFGSQAASDLMVLENVARADAFYRMWCRHEAHFKLGQAPTHDRFFSRPGLMLALCSTRAFEAEPALVDLDQAMRKSK